MLPGLNTFIGDTEEYSLEPNWMVNDAKDLKNIYIIIAASCDVLRLQNVLKFTYVLDHFHWEKAKKLQNQTIQFKIKITQDFIKKNTCRCGKQ